MELLTCNQPEFAALPPGQIVPVLADRGFYILNFNAFYEALLEAKGVSLGADGGGNGRGKAGRKLSLTTKLQFKGPDGGQGMLDLKPGDEFEIKLGRKQIQLIPLGGGEEE